MEIEPEALDRAIKGGRARERARCLEKVQEQIDIALGNGDLPLAGALSAAKAEIELGVPSPVIFAPVRLPDAGRAATEQEIGAALGHYETPPPPIDAASIEAFNAQYLGSLPRDGFAAVQHRSDDEDGTHMARNLLRARR